MKKLTAITLASLCALPLSGLAMQNGLAVSYGSGFDNNGDPSGIDGFNLAYLLQPSSWQWGHFKVLMNFSYGYWKTTNYPNNQSISTYGVAPVLRWYFFNNATATPFLQASVGVAALSNSYFGNRNLGSSMLFQDQGGIGLAFGPNKDYFATLQALHYSNASLSSENSGFTVPFVFTVGALF